MIDVKSQVGMLRKQADQIQLGRPEKIFLLEQAVQLADSHNELKLAFEIRHELMRVCNFSGQPRKVIVLFSWCLAQHDKHPGMFNEWEIMWKYKWIIGAMVNFPQIPLEKIAELTADATRRFVPYEGGFRALHQSATELCHHRGLMEQAQQDYEKFQSAPKGVYGYGRGLNNCGACEVYFSANHNIHVNKDAEALSIAVPLLKRQVTCEATGKTVFALVLLPLLRLGKYEEADGYHRTGYRLIAANPTFIDAVSSHITYLTIVDNLDKGVKLFGKHLIWALESVALADVFEFYLASALLFSRVEEKRETVKLRLPKVFPLYKRNGEYQVQALSDWLNEQLRSIADQFDARNKTDRFNRRIKEQGELWALFQHAPETEISTESAE